MEPSGGGESERADHIGRLQSYCVGSRRQSVETRPLNPEPHFNPTGLRHKFRASDNGILRLFSRLLSLFASNFKKSTGVVHYFGAFTCIRQHFVYASITGVCLSGQKKHILFRKLDFFHHFFANIGKKKHQFNIVN
jgi:hypothetical protein